jgi:hypothetical protein
MPDGPAPKADLSIPNPTFHEKNLVVSYFGFEYNLL